MEKKLVAYLKHYFFQYAPFCLMALFTGMTFVSLMSFRPDDVSFFYHATGGSCQNSLGYFGATLASFYVYFLGTTAYLVPFLMLYGLFFIAGIKSVGEQADRIVGVVSFVLLSSGVCRFYGIGFHEFSGPGGLLGTITMSLLSSFDVKIKGVILWTLVFASTILISRFAMLQLVHQMFVAVTKFAHYLVQIDNAPARFVRFVASAISYVCFGFVYICKWVYGLLSGLKVKSLDESIMDFEQDLEHSSKQSVNKSMDELLQELFGKESEIKELILENQESFVPAESSLEQLQEEDLLPSKDLSKMFGMSTHKKESVDSEKSRAKKYQLPDIEKMLVQGNTIQHHEIDRAALAEQSAILEEKLALFGVRGKVVRIHPGPVITLFEYKPDSHIKLSKILGLEDDLAMALQALNIRILAPIPGKDVVGFEVANKVRNSVLLSNLFHGAAWTKFKGHLPMILGEDTYGNHIVVDLASMPHLLIAGSTGSGKSVALNCMLVSLLCAKKPDELKLIIIDPKQIEFTAYERIAHLIFPVITDSKKAVPILKWVVMTMEERYRNMAELGVKNIFEYQKLREQRSELEIMQFIVVIIDELADLMMTTGKDAEDLIARIAQMSRAAGIHMIVATQRPSVDVITGLIKVNLPNRISFKVTSKVDSRTILDEMGAERLLGKGDMLFIDAKDPQIRRVHGAYVSEKEVHYLVKHIEAQQPPSFLDVVDMLSTETDSEVFESDQDLYQQVVDMLKDCDEVSISMIQRRFRIGYNRSARIVEILEARGLVMSSDGGKMRRVVKD
ncbi:MAG: DNA translocase FtsK 4TM domain-containing protein [Candidatus Dependentiae bacterium]|nr:DNA translocase FtsK 4TM domain-containing protein [Candidatus Dependentiae bacterium]